MLPLSEARLAWHEAISALVSHQWECQECSQDGTRRCAEGQRLYEAEQGAWREHARERWGRIA